MRMRALFVAALFLGIGSCNGNGPSPTPEPRPVPLVANPGGPYQGEDERPLQFSGLGSTTPNPPIVNYFWNFGDPGSPDNAVDHPTPTHTFTPGADNCCGSGDVEVSAVYTITLTIIDSAGNSATARTTATITYLY